MGYWSSEVAQGQSEDCNGVPDECDLLSPTQTSTAGARCAAVVTAGKGKA